MEFLRSFLRRHLAEKPVIASPNVGCFLRVYPATQMLVPLHLPLLGLCFFFCVCVCVCCITNLDCILLEEHPIKLWKKLPLPLASVNCTFKRQTDNRHFRSEKGTGAEMRPAMVSGVVTGEVSVTHWPIFFLSPITVPEIFAKVNLVQFLSRF